MFVRRHPGRNVLSVLVLIVTTTIDSQRRNIRLAPHCIRDTSRWATLCECVCVAPPRSASCTSSRLPYRKRPRRFQQTILDSFVSPFRRSSSVSGVSVEIACEEPLRLSHFLISRIGFIVKGALTNSKESRGVQLQRD